MFKVALTGGIASGKTAVSKLFETLGVPVIDADILSREAVAQGSSGLKAVVEMFGQEVLNADGSLNRKTLRQIVFSDHDARARLEAIIHPEVRRLTNEAIKQVTKQTDAPYCLIVIPLLVETRQHKNYDHVIVVDVCEETQISRVQQRDGSTEEQARNILRSQASRLDRLAVASTIIANNGSRNELNAKVKKIHQELLVLCGH